MLKHFFNNTNNMKQKHLNLLLVALIAACAFFAVSCGVSSATGVGDTGKLFFFTIDKVATGTLFLISGILLLLYWVLRFYLKPANMSYDDFIDELKFEAEDVPYEEGKTLSVHNVLAIMGAGHVVAMISPILMFWSWFIDSVERGFLFWILVILTYAAFRYGTELLGIDMWGFRNKWIVIWTIICVVGYIIIILL